MPRFLQMAPLRVQFKRIEHGNVEIIFHVKEAEYMFWPSYIYRNSFTCLIETLHAMIDKQGTYTVLWCDAPREYEMRFNRKNEIVTVEMWHFDSWDRTPKDEAQAYLFFSFSSTYDEVCLPFWRALRELQNLYSAEEFQTRWHSAFPTNELVLLTKRLGKN